MHGPSIMAAQSVDPQVRACSNNDASPTTGCEPVQAKLLILIMASPRQTTRPSPHLE